MPNDTLSLENAAVILSFTKPPLIIDQSGRAQLFMRTYIPDMEVVDDSSENLVSSIELAIRFGKTILIENITKLSPFIIEILRYSVLTEGSRPSLKLGEKFLDINPSFSIILSSKTFTYEDIQSVSGLVNPVIFSMTRRGLEHQLLSLALKSEMPKLEIKMNELVQREEDLQIEIFKIEDELLSTLAKSSGDLLENKELITSLKGGL
jgi:dynein heavy chain 2